MTYDPDLDFPGTVQKIGLAMTVLAGLDLAAVVSTVDMAHTMGPFLDPTKYRDALGRGDMDSIARLAAALGPAVVIWKEEIEPKTVRAPGAQGSAGRSH
jgi:hypothetical protein